MATPGQGSGTGSQPNRLETGGLVDRSRIVRFTFDGKTYTGHPGDTLASALIANGVSLTGRSFKYHRPRGILSAGSEEPNALVELREGARREPNTRATVAEVFDGLVARSQNRWPSLDFDVMAVNSLLSPIFVAGFYYKTFMWPSALWEKLYEPAIRRAAGLGRASDEADPDTYDKATAFADVLVIGGGTAGLAAALAAARTNARVILVDENATLGGRGVDDGADINGNPAHEWVRTVEAELSSAPNVRILRRTTAFGTYDGGTYGAVERVSDHLAVAAQGVPRQRLWRIVAKETVLASGATERPVVFGGNDRPGVMLAGAVRTYINRFGVLPGRRAVVFTNNDYGASTVAALKRAGAEVVALVDSRAQISDEVKRIASEAGARLLLGAVVTGTLGKKRVTGVTIHTRTGEEERLDCDLVAMSGGWNPNIQLTTHLGSKPTWNDKLLCFLPGTLPHGMSLAGAVAGDFTLGKTLVGGTSAGSAAVTAAGYAAVSVPVPKAADESDAVAPLWRVKSPNGKAFVDQQNDVTESDIELAEREGFRAVEHLKRYTTLGMATDQGRTANVNALAIMAEITGRTIPQTGITVARPPYTPVSLGTLAGHHREKHFKPTRLPPSYRWAKENGCVFVETGLWLRPSYFPRPGEKDWLETVKREVTTVRNAVGICDVSTLGKVDLQGADTAAFLDRIYMNGLKTLPIGKCRYGGMLREDGILMDDGTVARLGENHYFITTTTANAVKVVQHMEYCAQWLWPELDVQIVSATEQWAQYAVAGPKSRELLQKIVDPAFDITDAGFPYLGVGEITVCGGIKARLFRLSFSGERAYEIGVPARYGDALMRRLAEAGKEFGACAYGTEALGVMRIEKGHISGPELNGTTTPRDVGLGGMVSTKKDFIGHVLGKRPGLVDPERPALIGFRPLDRSQRLRSGAHFLKRDAQATAENDEGYMTSVAYSPSNGHWVGLGLLKRGPERIGEIVRAYDPVRGGDTLVEVVSPVFVDPEGVRVRG
ncbi:sarcosine oxidase subunit alpha family protein [Hyphomicrobium sp. LHD-15]|uniref:sarcosine oxidase subunit alpha family protein n=1 Tax=Hyphomicrobium sp. LHD-15 TaxID=3072142 RepID=UPI002810440D|nr:sarcosine oxidase subunit alpha family protein [Hyphomicrobium sp. LHD-15]MDQ8700704.1 sarcosine oxidase subunit alpha family protein [Hyphomicrobium sp. LHD-15]